jgi:diaminohydroxyphosphoribosylaminopyrimidine deaminase/5-amino-6-(5-phosphoribosylamino)uracil reductase
MQRALGLAEASLGLASPNPQVGCVLTRDGQVIGEGAHHYDARDHAEIVALKGSAAQGHSTQGAAAYVTLEPCSHHGRTGPCADALIAAGIRRCFVATVDPNPAVSGRGIAKLRAAGVEVHIGLEQARARAINNAFAWSITRGRPFVTLKAGLSVDGRLAPLPEHRTATAPHWLTGPESRAEVQRMRHAADAILTGIGTVLADDPLLTDRTGLPRRRPLLRVVLDRQLRIPRDSQLVATAQQDLLIATLSLSPFEPEAAILRVSHDSRGEAEVIAGVLTSLSQRGITSVLLEAGPTLNGAFLHAGLVDRIALFYSETELGPASLPFATGGPTPFELEQRLLNLHKQSFGADVCVSGLLHDPWASAPNIV